MDSITPATPAATPGVHEHTELFAVLSVVLPFVGMAIPGLVLGILSRRWSTESAEKNTLATVGIVLCIMAIIASLAFIVLFVFIFGHLFNTCHDLGPGVHQVGSSTYTCS